MTISEYIINDIDIRPLNQKVGDLKDMFNELTCSHIPIEKDGHYIGCISENDIRCFEDEQTLEEYRYALDPFYTRDNMPLLDIIKSFVHNDTNLLPVLSREENAYL